MTGAPVPNYALTDYERAVEAAVFASVEPLTPAQIAQFVGDGDVTGALHAISARHAGGGFHLVERGRAHQDVNVVVGVGIEVVLVDEPLGY